MNGIIPLSDVAIRSEAGEARGCHNMDIRLGDTVRMRKPHPCGSYEWTVTRTGADIKMKCLGCGRIVMLERPVCEKRLKKITARLEETENGEESEDR